ncbi:MAG: hypothetical protein RL226_566 [Bacteroidota bacterium]|jgi:hypothetical protein
MKAPRIAGIDFIYALLLPFILITFGLLETAGGVHDVLHNEYHLVFDSAFALFLFMNGLTTALAAGSGMNVWNLQVYLFKKGLIFLVIAIPLSFISISNPFMLLAALSIVSSVLIVFTTSIISFTLSAIVLYGAYSALFTEVRLDLLIQAPGYLPSQVIQYPLKTSYYAFLPWASFYLAGVLVSRLEFIRRASSILHLIVGIAALLLGLLIGFMTEVRSIVMFNKSILPQGLRLFMISFPGFFIAIMGLSIVLTDFNNWATTRFQNLASKPGIRHLSKSKYSVMLLYILLFLASNALFGAATQSWVRLGVSVGIAGLVILPYFLFSKSKFFLLNPVERVVRLVTGS